MTDTANPVATGNVPWLSFRNGFSMPPLHFEKDGYALQLRIGRVEYLDENSRVISFSDSATARLAYLEWCREAGMAPDQAIVGRV